MLKLYYKSFYLFQRKFYFIKFRTLLENESLVPTCKLPRIVYDYMRAFIVIKIDGEARTSFILYTHHFSFIFAIFRWAHYIVLLYIDNEIFLYKTFHAWGNKNTSAIYWCVRSYVYNHK